MSGNRAVQAAQRRRAGPVNNDSVRGPQPSINSAQMFANQSRPGNGPNIPSGRLAGQHVAQQMTQQQQQYHDSKSDKLSTVNKMTIPQAITLITLRLGVLEKKMLEEGDHSTLYTDGSNSGIDSSLLQEFVSRLDALEKRNDTQNSSTEFNLLKKEFDTVKQTLVQNKTINTTIVKETTSLKTQMENIKNDLKDIKELLTSLQNQSVEHSQKILELTLGTNTNLSDMILSDLSQLHNNEDGTSTDDYDLESQPYQIGEDSVQTDLKQLIESELRST